MLARALALVLTLAFPFAARAELSEDTGHAYTLEARLDPREHLVEGSGTIRWTNDSERPVRALYLHLYMNAFEDEDTVFMRESGGQLRTEGYKGPGSIRLRALTLDGHDLLANADAELIEGDRTQLRVELPAPVESGASIELSMRFITYLPKLFARAGYAGTFHMVAQWFPKVARLEPDGRWASFPYHGLGEFYADFARYDVELDVPEGYVVGATGKRVDASEDDGRARYRYLAERVHDFAWVAAPGLEERVDACHGIELRTLAPPELAWAAERARRVTCDSLPSLEARYGDYPYPVLTVIVPPASAAGSEGMEYPTLFTSSAEAVHVPSLHFAGVDDTTVHELAHQWFQGLVATNEVRWPMLDEGLTTWVGYDTLGELFGQGRSFSEHPALDAFEVTRAFVFVPKDPPPARPVSDFRMSSYGRVIYGRVPLVLETIARTYGRERVHAALGDYARRNRFGHPGPEDLFAAFEREFGAFIVTELLRPALFDGDDAAVALTREGAEVIAVRRGSIRLPSRVDMRCGDGTEASLPWPAAVERLVVTPPTGCAPSLVRVNASRHNLLDPTVTDDALEPSPRPRWASQALATIQLLLSSLFGP